MSCGSTTCNSTGNLKSASPLFPDLKWSWNILLVWLAENVLQRERRYQRGQLLDSVTACWPTLAYRGRLPKKRPCLPST